MVGTGQIALDLSQMSSVACTKEESRIRIYRAWNAFILLHSSKNVQKGMKNVLVELQELLDSSTGGHRVQYAMYKKQKQW